ncbi:hypothetical protein SNE40_021753 [Patella caerulea]|uniref:C-type lectin domain-containing protein n=1 Tax=Patella caerulea TaxID=87958 RepID=A0AAN8GGW2_PATCE
MRMDLLTNYFIVHILINRIPSNTVTITTKRGILQCSNSCGQSLYRCKGFTYNSTTKDCTLFSEFKISTARVTKFWVKIDQCPIVDGYIHLNDKGENLCIKFYFGSKNWIEAQDDCTSRGDQLVTLNTEIKTKMLYDYMITETVYSQKWWIGLKDEDGTNTYKWSDGSDVNYSNWNDSQPDFTYAGKDDDCVILEEPTSLFKWNDFNCIHNSITYICERQY